MSFEPKPSVWTEAEEQSIVLLEQILRYRRPYESATERVFVDHFIAPLAQSPGVSESGVDSCGNHWIRIGGATETMFTAHTDTVHSQGGMQQTIRIGLKLYNANLDCLGADDGTGCWILMQLMAAQVPGLYVFFRGEERGGIGSGHMAEKTPELVAGIKRCISFDRKGTTNVITHQGWGSRCCSDEFAEALAGQLCNDDLMYAPDDTGVFTDSANFTDLIPECTNLSVGYYNEHTKDEHQDLDHLVLLTRALLKVDWASLPTERDPTVEEQADWMDNWTGGSLRLAHSSDLTRLPASARRDQLSDFQAEDIVDLDYQQFLEMLHESDTFEIADLIQNLADDVVRLRRNRKGH